MSFLRKKDIHPLDWALVMNLIAQIGNGDYHQTLYVCILLKIFVMCFYTALSNFSYLIYDPESCCSAFTNKFRLLTCDLWADIWFWFSDIRRMIRSDPEIKFGFRIIRIRSDLTSEVRQCDVYCWARQGTDILSSDTGSQWYSLIFVFVCVPLFITRDKTVVTPSQI